MLPSFGKKIFGPSAGAGTALLSHVRVVVVKGDPPALTRHDHVMGVMLLRDMIGAGSAFTLTKRTCCSSTFKTNLG